MAEIQDTSSYSEECLERLSYRTLQQIAKSMHLPSNVKKMYLIQMIFAKTNRTEEDVADIVHKVKMERQLLSQRSTKRKSQKKKLQASEVTSTNSSQSPPISNTPKRPSSGRSKSPNGLRQTLLRYHQRTSSIQPTQSDRVLRSFNMKSYKKPNYSIMNNSIIGVIKAQKESQISILSRGRGVPLEEQCSKINTTAKCIVRKCIPNIVNVRPQEQQLEYNTVPQISKQRHMFSIKSTNSCPPSLPDQATNIYNYPSLQRIGFRHTDGKITKINAYKTYSRVDNNQNNYRNVEVTIQDIMNSNIETQAFNSEYTIAGSNPSSMSICSQSGAMNMLEYDQGLRNEEGNFVYYHKKIRAEKVRSQRQSVATANSYRDVPRKLANERTTSHSHDVISSMSVGDVTRPLYAQRDGYTGQYGNYSQPMRNDSYGNQPIRDEPLPQIDEAFGSFSRDVTRPLFVHVPDAYAGSTTSRPSLERLLNVVVPLTPAPVVRLPSASKSTETSCTFVRTTVTSAMVRPVAVASADAYYTASQRNPQYQYATEEVSRMSDMFSIAEQDITLRNYQESISSSTPSTEPMEETFNEPPPSVAPSIEDALELISQDGDYMERMEMDERMQCVLCDWAGPKVFLEVHIRREHEDKLVKQDKSDWNVTYKLGSVVNQQLWLSHVSDHRSGLVTVSVKYEDPDCFMASLTVLTSEPENFTNGSITIYNKITGEPYTWHGEIPDLPTEMPYSNTPQLKLELSKLELVPNSAKLKLVGRNLVPASPSKTVVGQPHLDDIHIIIFVHID